eukprot:TRINITY_DN3826_c0_g1_i9.p1 TRINITY_DN3826_c0_g1~~TRINITY_DN3826_c0_g1_i9.p1  ORF type:complete len:304 (+),score=39.78 TRINITY_DN3826_c0_g1_i9:636-1547(+)
MKKYQHLDSKAKRKMTQVIRNRISAQNSRDKKKVYVDELERENSWLKDEREQLIARITELETIVARCEAEKRSLLEGKGDEISIRQNSSGGGGYLTLFSFLAMVSVIALMGANVNTNIDSGNRRLLTGSMGFKRGTICPPCPCSIDVKNTKILDKVNELGKEFCSGKAKAPHAVTRNNTGQLVTGRLSSQIVHTDFYKDPTTSASLFCPSGVFVDLRDEEEKQNNHENRHFLTQLEDSEWLQLFIPRGNISVLNAKMVTEEGFLSSTEKQNVITPLPPEDDTSDANKLVELVCKVRSVRLISS